MDHKYASRKQTNSASPDKKTMPQGPSFDALRAGAAQPSAEQMGRRVDLPGAIRAKMEESFGVDLSAVKLYESRAVADTGAKAITKGPDIAFAPGLLDFSSQGGQALLGHEISHVVSQARGEVTGGGFLNDASLETRADREGAMAAAGEQIAMPTASLSPVTAAAAAGPMQAKDKPGKKKDFNPMDNMRETLVLTSGNPEGELPGQGSTGADWQRFDEDAQKIITDADAIGDTDSHQEGVIRHQLAIRMQMLEMEQELQQKTAGMTGKSPAEKRALLSQDPLYKKYQEFQRELMEQGTPEAAEEMEKQDPLKQAYMGKFSQEQAKDYKRAPRLQRNLWEEHEEYAYDDDGTLHKYRHAAYAVPEQKKQIGVWRANAAEAYEMLNEAARNSDVLTYNQATAKYVMALRMQMLGMEQYIQDKVVDGEPIEEGLVSQAQPKSGVPNPGLAYDPEYKKGTVALSDMYQEYQAVKAQLQQYLSGMSSMMQVSDPMAQPDMQDPMPAFTPARQMQMADAQFALQQQYDPQMQINGSLAQPEPGASAAAALSPARRMQMANAQLALQQQYERQSQTGDAAAAPAPPVSESADAPKPAGQQPAMQPMMPTMPMASMQPMMPTMPMASMQPMMPMMPMASMQPMMPMMPMQPMQPMGQPAPMASMAPMQPMQPLQPLQPMGMPMASMQPLQPMGMPMAVQSMGQPEEDFPTDSFPSTAPAPAPAEGDAPHNLLDDDEPVAMPDTEEPEKEEEMAPAKETFGFTTEKKVQHQFLRGVSFVLGRSNLSDRHHGGEFKTMLDGLNALAVIEGNRKHVGGDIAYDAMTGNAYGQAIAGMQAYRAKLADEVEHGIGNVEDAERQIKYLDEVLPIAQADKQANTERQSTTLAASERDAAGNQRGSINAVSRFIRKGKAAFFKPRKKDSDPTEREVMARAGIRPAETDARGRTVHDPRLANREIAFSRLGSLLGSSVTIDAKKAKSEETGKTGVLMEEAKGKSWGDYAWNFFGLAPKTEGGQIDDTVLDGTLAGKAANLGDRMKAANLGLTRKTGSGVIGGGELDAGGPLDVADPDFQRQMNEMFLLDTLAGHTDRHAGNFNVDRGADGKISVKAIDNDLTFGSQGSQQAEQAAFGKRGESFNYGGLPAEMQIDANMAEKITKMKKPMLEAAFKDLLEPEEIEALWTRFEMMKSYIATAKEKKLLVSQWNEETAKKEMQLAGGVGSYVREDKGKAGGYAGNNYYQRQMLMLNAIDRENHGYWVGAKGM